MPSWPTSTSWPSKSSWPSAGSWPSGTSWPSGAAPFTPLSITSVPIVGWWRSDLGVVPGTGVEGWIDQSGNGNDLAQAVGAKQPAYSASDAAFNGRPSLTFDGSDDELSGAFAIPAPGTTSRHYWFIFRQITWTASRCLFGGGGGNCQLLITRTSTPILSTFNLAFANNNANAALGTARRGRVLFSNSAADLLHIGSSLVTGASAGNASAASWAIGSGVGAAFANDALAEMLITSGAPSATELAQLDAYALDLYGAGVLA